MIITGLLEIGANIKRRKYTAKNYAGQSQIVEDSFENASGNLKINKDGSLFKVLTDDEKIILTDKLKKYFDDIELEKRGDYRVPESEKVEGIKMIKNDDGSKSYRIAEAWKKPPVDGAKNNTRC